MGVAYGTDIDKLETVARSVLKQNPRILAQPAPILGISEFGDSEIVYAIKPWVRVDDYLAAQTEIHRAVVQAFAASDIEMPFPQREVRVLTNGNSAASGLECQDFLSFSLFGCGSPLRTVAPLRGLWGAPGPSPYCNSRRLSSAQAGRSRMTKAR